MLREALADHFQSYFDRAKDQDTILWFDPDEEYVALLDHLTDVPLWRYEGTLLQVRYRLIERAPGERAVVYVPIRQDDAEILRPFFATSLIFRERLYRFLRRQGFDFPEDPQVAHEIRELLPRLAARSIGKGRAFWEYNLANLERARETLLGNFDDALLRFLAQAQVTLAELKGEKLDGLFFAQLESAYGLSATTEDEPDEVARRLAAQLILTCAYTQAEVNLREHEKVSVRTAPALARKSRCLVGPDLGKTEQLRVPVSGSQDLVAWFPRGVGSFRTPGPYNYVHGGLSLQELVVPHLTVIQQVVGRPVGVRARLPAVIGTAQFRVTLEPMATSIFDQPRQVTLGLEKAGSSVMPPLSCVVTPGTPSTLDVFLPMGCALEPGDQVRWPLSDAVTDEVLAEQEAISEVDLW